MSQSSVGLGAEGRRVIRLPAVIAKTGLSRCTIWRLEKAGDFPMHFELSPNAVGWDLGEVDGWIAERAAQRETAAA
jgi:prophage regulatory protein